MIKTAMFNWIRKIPVTSEVTALLLLRSRSAYLKRAGWFGSFSRGLPVDSSGGALPWYTYSAIDFLGSRIGGGMTVFEYGSGNSTLWWAARVSRVTSCEHDKQWYEVMLRRLPGNVDYMHIPLAEDGKYAASSASSKEKYDVVIVDGRDRVRCAANALNALTADGVIVWDNSDRKEYEEGFSMLRNREFKRLDFTGLGPINTYGWSTSIFYRSANCLGI